MDHPGEKLKRVREKLNLTLRDFEQEPPDRGPAGSDEFIVAVSRLADTENKGTTPTIFRIYTLCAIYRLDYETVLRWYGVPRGRANPSESDCAKLTPRNSLKTRKLRPTRSEPPARKSNRC